MLPKIDIRKMENGDRFLPKGRSKNLSKNNGAKAGNFLKSTKTNSPTSNSGATSLPPIGDSFMYTETSSSNHGPNVVVKWERTDIIQLAKTTFYLSRFSILTGDNLKNMGRFRIQLLLDENTWSTQYTIPKNSQNSNSSTEWKLINLYITIRNNCIKFILYHVDIARSDMCFSNKTITYSVH